MSEPIRSFTTAVPYWRPRITPLDIEEASDEQLEAMKVTTSNTKIGEFTLVLALDPETLLHFTPLINGIMSGQGGLSRPETELGAVSASVVNRSIYCAAAHSNQYNQLTKDDAVMDKECGWLAEDATGWKVTQDKSNPDKYLVKAKDDANGEEVTWTFVGSRLQVITTSKYSTNAGYWGC